MQVLLRFGLCLLPWLLAACSQPTTPTLDPAEQRYVDELQWFELSALQNVSGLDSESGWIADVLSDQLSGRRLLLPFDSEQLSPGIADIQLEYDGFPVPGNWSSPPGELQLNAGSGLLHNVIAHTLEPQLPVSQQYRELTMLEGRFSLDAAQLIMVQARQQRSPQPLTQRNPETEELWLLGRSPVPVSLDWQFSGQLGGLPFSFSASQEMSAVSSYYELRILDENHHESPARLSSHHAELLSEAN
jgi:hypothetical protein